MPPPDPETASGVQSGLVLDASGRPVGLDAGRPPPTALRPDASLAPEVVGHDEQAGVSLELAFRPHHLPEAPKVPELAPEGIRRAEKATAFTSSVDLMAMGRMRWVFTSHAMPFPFRSELRARRDRYGHILMWPSEGKYRVLAPGSLRTALNEARADVTPLSSGTKESASTGRRLGERTRVVTMLSSVGKIQLELATIPEAAQGGPLLCRSLVELVAIDPATPECKDDEVPLFASLEYAGGEGIDVEVTSLAKRTDIVPGEAACPPPGAEYQASGLPEASSGIFVTKEEMGAFRSRADAKIEPKHGAPTEGLSLQNESDRLLYFVIDGVPVAALPALSSRSIYGGQHGRYQGQWRSFLGDEIGAPAEIEIPGVVSTVKTPPSAEAGR